MSESDDVQEIDLIVIDDDYCDNFEIEKRRYSVEEEKKENSNQSIANTFNTLHSFGLKKVSFPETEEKEELQNEINNCSDAECMSNNIISCNTQKIDLNNPSSEHTPLNSKDLLIIEDTKRSIQKTKTPPKLQSLIDDFIKPKNSFEPQRTKTLELKKTKTISDVFEEMERASSQILLRTDTLPIKSHSPISKRISSDFFTLMFKKSNTLESQEDNTDATKKTSSLIDLCENDPIIIENINEDNPYYQKVFSESDKRLLIEREQELTKQLKEIKVSDETFEQIRKIAFEREEVRIQLKVITSRETTQKGNTTIRLKENDKVGRITLWKNHEAKKGFEPFKIEEQIPDVVQSTNIRSYPIWTNWWGENFHWKERVKEVLHKVFHHETLRLLQYPVINAILAGHNVLALMPTGGGKSLCYQLPSLFKDGYTLVVSPLISLMQDQVKALNDLGIPAITCNSNNPENIDIFINDIETRKIKIVYVAPELLSCSWKMNEAMKKLYDRGLFSYLVIDEAHCISQWGHDFRQSYVELREFRKTFPSVQTILFTATATERVKNDILLSMGLEEAIVFNQTFNRPNLRYETRVKSPKVEVDIAHYIQQHPNQCGIVFCLSKKDCESLSKFLINYGIRATHYHAGLDAKRRKKVQNDWMNGTFLVVCATVAFGMGIDKPDVRFVIHQTMPSSIEQYFQESGRAGRDGKPSDCIIYFSMKDIARVEWLKRDMGKNELTASQQQSINAMVNLCITSECRRKIQLMYFDESFNEEKCTGCDNCERKKK
ncbi:recQ family helicase, putative [Entamoeba histolytica HM-1:IMSS-B]|uniref:ATP-dependent DNA helicase n=6 Tax=Entamoeba histolytica TaxID=5759 RepID=C4M4X8_ENTH1|nr:recQ family helicase, putative [Entamoeba histolytica HM-1:IMSS]EMD49159.1 recQ family helicase [Entamoeba histolytica KU27]EMH74355.1 recQ family helicase, putative [Entamoeba histolytica HM-1:IMSS-B]EMS11350.1 recQ family helicase [Entamoeba histolytica HM-3:IMSS]ENY62742.1 recQ family helicase, putative [Entamoeba histolytica HM-1:IMSS-A]GAT96445.1 RecG family helicase putative [Entamoeba histolytica]|eukprot:XP_650264.1 recQ family helicase, putative [Entamoeba histolytica HM-1:IMSS]